MHRAVLNWSIETANESWQINYFLRERTDLDFLIIKRRYGVEPAVTVEVEIRVNYCRGYWLKTTLMIKKNTRSSRLLVHTPGVFDFRLLHYKCNFLVLFDFGSFGFSAKAWVGRDPVAGIHCHPFLSLCCCYVGVWWVVFSEVLKLVRRFGGCQVSTIFKRIPDGSLREK